MLRAWTAKERRSQRCGHSPEQCRVAHRSHAAVLSIQVVAAAALFLASKVSNRPANCEDCATVIAYAAFRIVQEPVFSSELQIAYDELAQLQRKGGRDGVYARQWEVRAGCIRYNALVM
jgi:hypothetical protein